MVVGSDIQGRPSLSFSRFDNSGVTLTSEKSVSRLLQSPPNDYTDDRGSQYREGGGQTNRVKEGSWGVFMPGFVWAAWALGF